MAREKWSGAENNSLTDIKEERSKQIWVFRAFAILSVCCAHMPAAAEKGTIDFILARLIALYGTIGVAGFLICSGYYFRTSGNRSWKFWRTKIYKLVLPWLLLTALVRCWYIYIGNGIPTFREHLLWALGSNTWLYFIPLLFELLVIFSFVRAQRGVAILGIVSIISNIATILGYGYGTVFTPYMNPFNWAIFFCIGVTWKNREKTSAGALESKKCTFISLGIFIFSMIVYCVTGWEAYYWTWISFFFELSAVFCLLKVSYWLRDSRLLQDIGKNTLFIYIVHMIVAGGVMNHMPDNGIYILLRPFVTLAITYVLTWIIRKVITFMHLERWIFLLGMSKNRM